MQQQRFETAAPCERPHRPRPVNLQDAFLNQVRREHQRITLFLMTAVKMGGVVRGFHCFVLVLAERGTRRVISRRAFSPMLPSPPAPPPGAGDSAEAGAMPTTGPASPPRMPVSWGSGWPPPGPRTRISSPG